MAVDVNTKDDAVQILTPKQLFLPPKQLFLPPLDAGWDVTADGKRFLMSVAPSQQNTEAPITVVLNWQADLKR